MVIFISGASGYLGSHLVKCLSRDHQVFSLLRTSSSITRIEGVDTNIIFVDDHKELESAFYRYKPDVVINTAALYGRCGESLSCLVNANIDFPTQLLDLSKRYNCKAFINTGTSLPDELSPYSLTKNTFVKLAKFNNESSLKFINISLEHFYGPEDDNSKFISNVINKCLSGEELSLTDGLQQRDFIYIDDVIEAYRLIVNNIEVLEGFETIPVGSGSVLTIKEVVKSIHAYLCSKSKLNFGSVPIRNNELMYSCADISRLEELGWIKKYNFNDGLRKTLYFNK